MRPGRQSPWAGGYETPETEAGRTPLPDFVLDEVRRSRRHPRITQKDFLHLRRLLTDLRGAIAGLPEPPRDVLDVFAGTAPYRDLVPGANYVRLDVNRRYGTPEILSDRLDGVPGESFDLVMCIEGFQYMGDPPSAVAEMRRALRPGGTALVTVPLVWEYDPRIVERRWTGPELAELFHGWEDVRVVENGGRGITWATVTGANLSLLEQGLARRLRAWRVLRALFGPLYLAVNALGAAFERVEARFARTPLVLPMNLLVSARRPS